MKRSEYYQMVTDFHKTFGVPEAERPVPLLALDRVELREGLIEEEYKEFVDAVAMLKNLRTLQDNYGWIDMQIALRAALADVADSLGDMMVVILGTCLEFGINPDQVMREIQLSNMSKLGDDGKPIYREDGKILKGPGYFKADMYKVLYGPTRHSEWSE